LVWRSQSYFNFSVPNFTLIGAGVEVWDTKIVTFMRFGNTNAS